MIDAYQAEQWTTSATNLSKAGLFAAGSFAAIVVPFLAFNAAWGVARNIGGLLGVAPQVDNFINEQVMGPLKGQSSYRNGRGMQVVTPHNTIKRVPYYCQLPVVGWVYSQWLRTRGIEYTGQSRSEWAARVQEMQEDANVIGRSSGTPVTGGGGGASGSSTNGGAEWTDPLPAQDASGNVPSSPREWF